MAKKPPAKGRSKGKGSKYDRWITIGIILTLIAIALSLWGPLRRFRISEVGKPAQQVKKVEPVPKLQITPEKPEKKKKAEKRGPREAKQHEEVTIVKPSEKAALVAIVIDDLGQDLRPAREIASLPAKVTFAVMPGFPQSRKVAELAMRNNREVLLHLPMEYRSKNGKPAPGMLRADMTPMDFLNTISDDVASVPGAVGVNNHEGSSLTENVFLDNESDNEEYIRGQLEELTRMAKEHGWAIGIGHPHPATISALRIWIAEANKQGVTIVPLSRLMQ
jgi:polysaccharide deacetylase 2 family uncharacterized protein YibQ